MVLEVMPEPVHFHSAGLSAPFDSGISSRSAICTLTVVLSEKVPTLAVSSVSPSLMPVRMPSAPIEAMVLSPMV